MLLKSGICNAQNRYKYKVKEVKKKLWNVKSQFEILI